jgi:hypothetical protein
VGPPPNQKGKKPPTKPPGKPPGKGPGAPKPPKPGKRRPTLKAGAMFGQYKIQDKEEFKAHAKEVRDVVAGRDVVEKGQPDVEKRPAPFDREELGVVRSWVQKRPLEANSAAAAFVRYPRLWATKRGRYSRFQMPGAGVVGVLRARPTW